MKNMVNRVQLVGRLGMDPELKKFDNGTTLARMSLATDAGYRDRNGQKINETHWHTLVAWGKLAELSEKLLQKGNQVAITGKLVNRSFLDGQGVKRYSTEIQLIEFIKTEKKPA